jgi:hypothetical protein
VGAEVLTLAAGTPNAVVDLEVEPIHDQMVGDQGIGVVDVTFEPHFRLDDPPTRPHVPSTFAREISKADG